MVSVVYLLKCFTYYMKGISSNINNRMYGDEVPPSTSSYQHAESQPTPQGTEHNKPRRHSRSTPERPGQPRNSYTTDTEKHQCTPKPISTSQKPDRQLVCTRNLSVRFLTCGNPSPPTEISYNYEENETSDH